ncbi:hypothetical protein [Sphingomonas sp. R86521]|uniref:hypothetical protein n=1 Tax=Sphingomonas sp. R86521 TaxID=3093860 RepID=UPI0036D417C8
MIAQFKKIALAVALGASTLAVAAPAEAQRYGAYRGRDDGSTAIVAGVAGLALGAVLASSANRRDGGYYDRGYDGPIVAYPQAYDGYYAGTYPRYDGYRGYDGYDAHYSRRNGGYDRGRGYADRRDRRDDRHDGGYDRGGRDGYRR